MANAPQTKECCDPVPVCRAALLCTCGVSLPANGTEVVRTGWLSKLKLSVVSFRLWVILDIYLLGPVVSRSWHCFNVSMTGLVVGYSRPPRHGFSGYTLGLDRRGSPT